MCRGQTDYPPQILRPSYRAQDSKVRDFPRFSLVCSGVRGSKPLAAVRKNRYVILPVDFEESWKVRCLYQLAPSRDSEKILIYPPFSLPLHHSQRSSGQTIHTSFVSLHAVFS